MKDKAKLIKRLIAVSILLLVAASTAVAAFGFSVDDNNIMIIAFLAFCALIVVGQALPCLLAITAFKIGMKKEAVAAKAVRE